MDVAAYNFWLRPLGLYALAETLRERGAEVSLVDCLSPSAAPGKFPSRPFDPAFLPADAPKGLKRYGIDIGEYRRRIAETGPVDAVLVSTSISWWYPGAGQAIAIAREIHPDAVAVMGGVYPTLWPEHAARRSKADHILAGTLRANLGTLCGLLGLPTKPSLPRRPWWELGLHDGAAFGAVRTAWGCPERCTYCASRLLSDGWETRTADDVATELTALWNLGVSEVAFYDDALLVGARERLFPAIRKAMASGASLRFQTPNGLHARLIDAQTAETMVKLGFTGFRLSLETTDAARGEATGGKVVKEEVASAVESLTRAGADPASIGVYLLIGLPGQATGEVEESIRFVRGLGVRPYLAEFSPIPGTVEWEKAKSAGFLGDDTEPLWTNNSLYLTHLGGWSEDEVRRLKTLARTGK